MNELSDLLKRIEKFPHIVKNIEYMWGSIELDKYLLNLFLDTRDGNRQGFPKDVAIALNLIIKLNDQEIASKGVQNINDIWRIQ